jgi:hypothetical protein
MKQVWYLSISDKQQGLVLVDELPTSYYSPGFFIIEGDPDPENTYIFLAAHDNDIVSTEIVKKNGMTFTVEHPDFGVFGFRAQKIPWQYRHYVGGSKELEDHGLLWRLFPLDDRKLEAICQEDDFYFVGYSGERE